MNGGAIDLMIKFLLKLASKLSESWWVWELVFQLRCAVGHTRWEFWIWTYSLHCLTCYYVCILLWNIFINKIYCRQCFNV
jgi:hypothetical protein